MTSRGAELLRDELQRLKTVERPSISQAIAEARSHGDLSENAEYDAARERQGFIEARIGDIEAKPAEGRISNESPVGRALLGKKKGDKVVVKVPAGDFTYKIVGIT